MTHTAQPSNRSRIGRSLSILVVVGFVASCTAATTSESPAADTAQPIATATASRAPSAAEAGTPSEGVVASSGVGPTSEPTGVATTIDPCQLVPIDEVNQLSGGQFPAGSGQSSTTEGNGKLCEYGEEGVVFDVVVGVAPDVAAAKAGEQAFEAELQKDEANSLTVTELNGFANGAADVVTLTGSKAAGRLPSYSATAIYVLKGTTFFSISDIGTLGAGAPSSQAIQDEAMKVLGRLP